MSNSEAALPTRETLSTEYGFEVPEAFVTIVRLAYQSEPERSTGGLRGLLATFQRTPAKRDADPALFYEEVCGLILGPDCRYPQTPPELFPIGRMGVDGVHYGYVVHAPELTRPDYPIGQLCPADAEGAFLVGRDTRSAFENLLSSRLSDWEECKDEFEPGELKENRRRLAEITRALQISPHASKASRRYGPDGNGLPIIVDVLAGWKHLPTTDGVGVLAKCDAFAPDESPMPDAYSDPGAFISRGSEALAAGFPATALALYREGFWHNWTDQSVVRLLTQGMGECYRQLGRPMLAKVLDHDLLAG